MADSAIVIGTAAGEVRIATDLIVDPQFGPVHLLRIVGGAGGGGSGMSLAEFQGELPLPVLEQAWPASWAINNFPASFGSVQSGAWNVGVNNFPAGFDVNNWPATQPVSLASVPTHGVTGPLTNTELRASAVPVSGTFWQTTQPVSGTVGVNNFPAVQPVNDNGGSLTVDGVFWQATQPVSGPATDAQLRASAIPVEPLFSSRVVRNLFMAAPIITTNAEVMQLLTQYYNGAAVAATATPAVVPTGKILRLTNLNLTYVNVATIGSARFTLRCNLAGTGAIGSPLVCSWQVGISGDGASTAGHVTSLNIPLPDSFEFPAASGIALGMQGFGAVPTTGTAVGYGKAELHGFEYTP